MSLNCTKKLQSILIFKDFKSRLEASKMKAIERILVCEFLISLYLKSFFQCLEYDVHMHRTIFFTFVLVMVSNNICDTFGDASFNGIVSGLLASRNRIPNYVFPWDLFLFVTCMLNRIAASRGCSKCRGYCSFSKLSWKFSTRFQSIQIFWTITTVSRGKLDRFETHVFEVFFLRTQQGTVIYNSWFVTMNLDHESFFTTTCRNPYGAP